MKVASLLAHLSGFEEAVVLVDPSVEERLKYSFSLEPADLVALPVLGEHSGLHTKCVNPHEVGAMDAGFVVMSGDGPVGQAAWK